MKKLCSITGCKNKHAAKGLCINHYMRERNRANKQQAPTDPLVKQGTLPILSKREMMALSILNAMLSNPSTTQRHWLKRLFLPFGGNEHEQPYGAKAAVEQADKLIGELSRTPVTLGTYGTFSIHTSESCL